MDDLELYMKDLRRAQSMNFDKLYLVHTLSYEPYELIVDANQKISDYISYREKRELLILNLIEVKFIF